MKKVSFIIVLLITVCVGITAQKQTDYNRSGDEAMSRLDYGAAKLYYEEGVSKCDTYSIIQLITVWVADSSMRQSMRLVMNKGLDCLTNIAMDSKDTVCMQKLVYCYREGVGTSVDMTKANYWQNQLRALERPSVNTSNNEQKNTKTVKKPARTTKTNFFFGYNGSVLTPVGLKAGIVFNSIGIYAKYATNLSTMKYTEICDLNGNIEGLNDAYPNYLGNKKTNAYAMTGGLIIKALPQLYLSVGGGVWQYETLFQFNAVGITEAQLKPAFWAKNKDWSYSGIAADIDATLRIGKTFYCSAGCSVYNFKYVYANGGIGVFF
ncbi:MAG: hypothetical protein LBD53_10645 [Tannerella sp.]|jgi:hypothetical protein|nr:hypothetical protein [Tannerella sp.]